MAPYHKSARRLKDGPSQQVEPPHAVLRRYFLTGD
jgi:hypothetical protein